MVSDYVNCYCRCLLRNIDGNEYKNWIENKPKIYKKMCIFLLVIHFILFVLLMIFINLYKEKSDEIYYTYYFLVLFINYSFAKSYIVLLNDKKILIMKSSIKEKSKAAKEAINLTFGLEIKNKKTVDVLIDSISEYYLNSKIFIKWSLLIHSLPSIISSAVGFILTSTNDNLLSIGLDFAKNYYPLLQIYFSSMIFKITKRCVNMDFDLLFFPTDYMDAKQILCYYQVSHKRFKKNEE